MTGGIVYFCKQLIANTPATPGLGAPIIPDGLKYFLMAGVRGRGRRIIRDGPGGGEN